MTTQAKPAESKCANSDLATVLHSDLEPDFIAVLTEVLQSSGYAVQVLTPAELGDLNQRAITLIAKIKPSKLIILDEQIGGRSALEYVLNIKADGEIQEIPMALLCTNNPDFFTGSAFFTAGVDCLLDKFLTEPKIRFHNFFSRLHNLGENVLSGFTRAANRTMYFAQEEARRYNQSDVTTEHLLLGLLHADPDTSTPSLAVKVLVEEFGLSIEHLRRDTEIHLQPTEPGKNQEMQLTALSKRVIDLAFDEARLLGNNFVGTEHLLLGLLRLDEAISGAILRGVGLELAKLRSKIFHIQNYP